MKYPALSHVDYKRMAAGSYADDMVDTWEYFAWHELYRPRREDQNRHSTYTEGQYPFSGNSARTELAHT